MNDTLQIQKNDVNYKKRMAELQEMMAECSGILNESKKSLIVVFEGLDASGKSGCIRRLVRDVDMKQYAIHPTSKPNEEEYARHYLWRFWRKIPAYGKIAVFDRSWYGRVLVERVEGLCRTDEWLRAYREINSFEKQLFDDGGIIIKLWLDVSEEEQLRRFKSRMETPGKEHKLTDEDWRNRSKRSQYIKARDEMIALTSKGYAPWHIISADDKKSARIASAEKIISWVDFLT